MPGHAKLCWRLCAHCLSVSSHPNPEVGPHLEADKPQYFRDGVDDCGLSREATEPGASIKEVLLHAPDKPTSGGKAPFLDVHSEAGNTTKASCYPWVRRLTLYCV